VDCSATNTISQNTTMGVVASEGSGTTLQGDFVVPHAAGAAYSGMIARANGVLTLSTAQQIKYYANANCTVNINVVGWRF